MVLEGGQGRPLRPPTAAPSHPLPPLARSRPSAESATPRPRRRVPSRVARGRPRRPPTAAPSRRRRRWPAPAVGRERHPRTPPVWPAMASGRPLPASHSRTVPSTPPLASRPAVGRERHARTPPVWPSERSPVAARLRPPTAAPSRPRRRWPAAGRRPRAPRPRPRRCGPRASPGPPAAGLPQPHRPVVAAAGHQPAVGRERHAPRPRRCGPRASPAGRPLGLPQPHRPVPPPLASRRPSADSATPQTPPVWPSRVASGRPVGLPQPHRPVRAAAGQQPAVGRQRHAPDPAGVALEGRQGPPAVGLPQPHRPVPPPLASSRPSAETARPQTPPVWPWTVHSGVRSATRHSHTSPVDVPAASNAPSPLERDRAGNRTPRPARSRPGGRPPGWRPGHPPPPGRPVGSPGGRGPARAGRPAAAAAG